MIYTELENYLKKEGVISIYENGYEVKLNLHNPHERRYAACYVCEIEYPQFDIDRMLINKFVSKGDRVLDAGANIGLTALLFLTAGAAHVTAVEPLPELYSRIKSINCEKITALKVALSDSNGLVDFYISELHNQGSTYDIETVEMFSFIFNEKPKKITVPRVSLDSIDEKFDIWKMDIEGAEIDTIKGASKTLSSYPPRVIMAELYGENFKKFQTLISDSHPFCYRACINKKEYTLELLDNSDFSERECEFHVISPTFIFSIDEVQF